MLAVLLLVGLAAAQAPERCSSPLTLQGRELSYDYERRFERDALWVYDAYQEAVAWYETIDLNSTRDAYHDIWLWKERSWYRFNIRSRQCIRYELTLPFAKLEIPPNARFVESRYIGSLLVNVWAVEGEDVFSKYRSERVFTAADCISVYVTKFRPTTIERSAFFNLTQQITRRDLFVVPEECKK